ncbi:hypothetical protein F5Y08DRAFT_54083 [Xylaria arbuscula]|nr:hypothetical protein F5Y08DRAFT_54083 [Xylaria arbuscula]
MAASLLPILFLSLARIPPVQSAVPRLGALDDATLFGVVAPRWYAEGIPAIPAAPMSPNPPHLHLLLDGFTARDVSMCLPGSHTCAEANAPGTCCPDDRYCYLDASWAAQCCPLGLECKGSKCDSEHLYCNTTISTTIPVTTARASATNTAGHSEEDTVLTSFVSVTTSTACCNRACSTDMFSCEAAFGGHCCKYGRKCAATSLCIANLAQSTGGATTTEAGIPAGCTATSQFSCAASEGGGCCNTGSVCTSQIVGAATSNVCAPDPAFSSSAGLSSGAKAGIGVGVAVGAALVIGAVTWLCIRRRRRPGTTGTNASVHQMWQNTGAVGGGGIGGGGGVGGGVEDAPTSMFNGPGSPRDPLSAYTQRSGWTMAGNNNESAGVPLMHHERGGARGYHPYQDGNGSSDARAGPYTDREGGPSPPNPSLATTPPNLADTMPFGPDHILRPVEIGGAESQEMGGKGGQGNNNTHIEEMPVHNPNSPDGRFELVGSLPSPSPLNPDGVEINPMDKIPR